MQTSVKVHVPLRVVMIVVKNAQVGVHSHVLVVQHPEIMEINNGGENIWQVHVKIVLWGAVQCVKRPVQWLDHVDMDVPVSVPRVVREHVLRVEKRALAVVARHVHILATRVVVVSIVEATVPVDVQVAVVDVRRVLSTVVLAVGGIVHRYVVIVPVVQNVLPGVPMHARDLVRSHVRVPVKDHVSLIVQVVQVAPVLVKALVTVHVVMHVLLNVVVRVKLTVPAHVQVVIHNAQMHVLVDVMDVHLHALDSVKVHVVKAA